MVDPAYVPDKGHIVKVNFDPQAGHEQAGWRPALVLSPTAYNKHGLAIVVPITNQVKGYPFEVALPSGLEVAGVILSDQLRSLDWRARKARRIGRVAREVLAEAVGKLLALVDPEEGAR